jgi:hypothetical protein
MTSEGARKANLTRGLAGRRRAEPAQRGFLNIHGRPYAAARVNAMLVQRRAAT